MTSFRYLIIAHLIFGTFIQSYPFLISLHAWIAIFLGVYWALFNQNSNKSTIIIFYLTGSELLWRGFNANVFWEVGKYSSILIMIIIIYRYGLERIKNKIGLLFMVLLLPSFIALNEFIRQDISHAMGGPVCLGVALILFSNQQITKELFISQFQSLLLPIITLMWIMILSTFQFGQINFYAAYIYEYTTAGIGPNQASNILGLGVLTSFLLYLIDNKNKAIYSLIGFALLFQTIISYSRGGFWNAILAIGICILFSLRTKKTIIKFIPLFSIICFLFYSVLFPLFDEISEGSISSRYTDTDFDRREFIINTELKAFKENPLFGIGPGQSRKFRIENYDNYKHTHTEYSRLLSEHGIFGISIIILLGIIVKINFMKNRGLSRSIVLALMTWSLLFMFHSATRLVAPSIIFGFSVAHFMINNEDK